MERPAILDSDTGVFGAAAWSEADAAPRRPETLETSVTVQAALPPGTGHQLANMRIFPAVGAEALGPGSTGGELAAAETATTRPQRPSGPGEEADMGLAPDAHLLSAGEGSGRPLDAGAQASLETGLGADLSRVRVHTDGEADRLSRAVDAVAFTSGPDIFFRAGRYNPASPAGFHLLAHEATHAVQHARQPAAAKPAAESLRVSAPSDAAEQIADRAAAGVMAGEQVDVPASPATGALAAIQRKSTEIDLPFIGGGFIFSGKRGDDSSVTFDPWGTVGTYPGYTSFTDFPSGSSGDVEISAGASTVARISMKLHIFEDNVFINETMDQRFDVEWKVAAAPDGKLTIDSNPTTSVGAPSDDGLKAGLSSINPTTGADYLRVSPVISSAGGSAGLAPGGVGVTVNTPGQFVTAPFTLNIKVKDIAPPKEPTGTVTIGPISALRTVEVYFADPKTNKYKGVDTLVGGEQTKLLRFYNDLNETTRKQLMSGAAPVTLEAHASTTGSGPYNLDLAARRLEYVKRILRGLISDGVRFSEQSRAPGEYEAETPDETESDQERKVVISVWEQISEGEKPPGSAGP